MDLEKIQCRWLKKSNSNGKYPIIIFLSNTTKLSKVFSDINYLEYSNGRRNR